MWARIGFPGVPLAEAEAAAASLLLLPGFFFENQPPKPHPFFVCCLASAACFSAVHLLISLLSGQHGRFTRHEV